jgi:hypothetical protein
MKRYRFLIKPLFYIFSLTASSYLVIVIERVSPSDFSKHPSLFLPQAKPVAVQSNDSRMEYLKNICFDYKYGIIDSSTLDERISVFLYGAPQKPFTPQIATITRPNRILLQRINE